MYEIQVTGLNIYNGLMPKTLPETSINNGNRLCTNQQSVILSN